MQGIRVSLRELERKRQHPSLKLLPTGALGIFSDRRTSSPHVYMTFYSTNANKTVLNNG